MHRPDRLAIAEIVPPARLAWIAGALTTAAQPARLAVGFVVALTLWCGGMAWDLGTGPSVDPPGILAEPWGDIEQAEAERTMRRLAAQLVPEVNFEGARMPAAELASLLTAGAAAADDPDQAERYRVAARRVERLVPMGAFEALCAAEGEACGIAIDGVRSVDLRAVAVGIRAALLDVPMACIARTPVFAAVFGAWAILGMAVGLGAMARMEAVHSSGRGMLPARAGLEFAARRWPALAASWLGPVAVAAALGVPCIAFGALFRFDLGGWIGAALYVVPLALGAIGGIALVLGALGAPTGPAAVACDGLGGLEASQRGAIYFLSRPLLWMAVLAVSAALAGLGVTVLRSVAWALTAFPSAMVSIGSGGAAPEAAVPVIPGRWQWPADPKAAVVWWWVALMGVATAGATLSLLAGLSARAFLVMREACDGQPADAIWPFEVPSDVTDDAAASAEVSPVRP